MRVRERLMRTMRKMRTFGENAYGEQGVLGRWKWRLHGQEGKQTGSDGKESVLRKQANQSARPGADSRLRCRGTPPCRTASRPAFLGGAAARAWRRLPGSSSTSRTRSKCIRCRFGRRPPCSGRGGRGRYGRTRRRRILRAKRGTGMGASATAGFGRDEFGMPIRREGEQVQRTKRQKGKAGGRTR